MLFLQGAVDPLKVGSMLLIFDSPTNPEQAVNKLFFPLELEIPFL